MLRHLASPTRASLRVHMLTPISRLLLDLKPRVIYPAHGPPCLDGVPLLAMYIKHREQRESAILASYQRGNKLPEEIVLDVYADVPAAMHVFAVRNVELHLRKLR